MKLRRDTTGSCRAHSPALHVGRRDRVASIPWPCSSHPHAHLHAQVGLISASVAPSAVIYHRRRRTPPDSCMRLCGPACCSPASRPVFAKSKCRLPNKLARATPERLLHQWQHQHLSDGGAAVAQQGSSLPLAWSRRVCRVSHLWLTLPTVG